MTGKNALKEFMPNIFLQCNQLQLWEDVPTGFKKLKVEVKTHGSKRDGKQSIVRLHSGGIVMKTTSS